MIDYQWDAATAVLRVRPGAPLDKSDFVDLAKAIDPVIEQGHDVAGLIIDAPHFPGWDSLGALVSHIRFVRDHHRHVKKIAVVTDAPFAELAPHLIAHFVSAQIQHFPAGQVQQAQEWIASSP